MRSFSEFLTRKRAEHGPSFDHTDLNLRFVRFFESGERIRVKIGSEVLTGTVGVTTGWRPTFLLLLYATSAGSSTTLGPSAVILARKVGRRYVSV